MDAMAIQIIVWFMNAATMQNIVRYVLPLAVGGAAGIAGGYFDPCRKRWIFPAIFFMLFSMWGLMICNELIFRLMPSVIIDKVFEFEFRLLYFATNALAFIGMLAISVQMGWVIGFVLSNRFKGDRGGMGMAFLIAFFILFILYWFFER